MLVCFLKMGVPTAGALLRVVGVVPLREKSDVTILTQGHGTLKPYSNGTFDMILTSDSETTTWSNGSVYDPRNFVVCIGWKEDNGESNTEFGRFELFEDAWRRASLAVLFNAKFDLGHYRKLGIDISHVPVWCCQIGEFLLSGQTTRFPSLEQAAEKYGLGNKIDVIKLEYWEKGINTDAIPRDILGDYCAQDVSLTYQVYLRQLAKFEQRPKLFKLFKLMCQDLLVLQEMEWNGLVYDKSLCEVRSEEIEKEVVSIQSTLSAIYPDIEINFSSGDQLSAFLYGGAIKKEGKEEIGTFKTGARKGLPKFKNITIEHQLPRLVEPLKNSELAKDGYFKTDEATLRKLRGKAATKFVGPLLRLAELQKLNGTYYTGLPKLAEEMNWEGGTIHGQLNQCVAQTGRLSSSKPNLQNFSGEMQDVFVSRYKD